MIEHHLDIPTANGLMNTFITHPEEDGPHPVVLFYMRKAAFLLYSPSR